METTIVNGYHVAGNYHVAIAINVIDPTDAHYFTPTEYEYDEMGAYDKAIAWTSPGL